jgi:hypothetical protein
LREKERKEREKEGRGNKEGKEKYRGKKIEIEGGKEEER